MVTTTERMVMSTATLMEMMTDAYSVNSTANSIAPIGRIHAVQKSPSRPVKPPIAPTTAENVNAAAQAAVQLDTAGALPGGIRRDLPAGEVEAAREDRDRLEHEQARTEQVHADGLHRAPVHLVARQVGPHRRQPLHEEADLRFALPAYDVDFDFRPLDFVQVNELHGDAATAAAKPRFAVIRCPLSRTGNSSSLLVSPCGDL